MFGFGHSRSFKSVCLCVCACADLSSLQQQKMLTPEPGPLRSNLPWQIVGSSFHLNRPQNSWNHFLPSAFVPFCLLAWPRSANLADRSKDLGSGPKDTSRRGFMLVQLGLDNHRLEAGCLSCLNSRKLLFCLLAVHRRGCFDPKQRSEQPRLSMWAR